MKKNKIASKIFLCLGVLFLTSCGINSNLMLKTHKEYEFASLDSTNTTKEDYQIDVNDIVQFSVFTNKGQRILDATASPEGGAGNQNRQMFSSNNSLSYIVQSDSLIKLPLIGQVNIVGKTIRETELYFEEIYDAYYVDAFVQVTVTNKRVIVFPGNGGDAQVIYLANNNTTLLEAIALAGGITERGRASKIKLIRKNDEGKRDVYLVDLSTIEGLEYTDLLVQANDYIYVEPVPQLSREILAELAPIVSIISSAALVITVINSFQ